MITIVQKYIILKNKKKLNKEITKHIFKKLDLEKYIKMMNTSNNMPDNNMNRMFISYFRENLIAHFLNMKYVGDKKEWETDCIYPMNVQSPNEFHIKYEIKIRKNMFLRNGNTNGIILKNGRGEGSKIKSLLKTILKNNFLLINSSFPYNIAYVDPIKFMFYFNSKKNAKTYEEIIYDESFLNNKCAELCAYAKKEDLFYVHEYDDSSEYKHGAIISDSNKTFNPFKKIIDEYICDNL